jgi:excisionase family DNA binding protein
VEALLDVESVAKLFKVSPATIRHWIAEGKLPVIRVGRGLRFRLTDIEGVLERSRTCVDQAPENTHA